MPKLMMPLSRISSALFLLLVSCGSNKVVKEYRNVALKSNTFEVPYFSNKETDYVYKANITVYGKELTGLFIAKKIDEDTHRIVFTTEFGNKLLDFEISETDFKVNFILEELDKKFLINILVNDFRLLLRSHYTVDDQFENNFDIVYETLDKDKMNYLFVSKATNSISKIVHSSKRKKIITILYTSKKDIFAENIIIEHQNIKLKIELNYLSE